MRWEILVCKLKLVFVSGLFPAFPAMVIIIFGCSPSPESADSAIPTTGALQRRSRTTAKAVLFPSTKLHQRLIKMR